VSLLILCTGFLGCTQLLVRIQLAQLQSNQSLKAMLMLDYAASQLAIGSEVCYGSNQSQHSCQLQRPAVVGGMFDGSHLLLDGYVELDPTGLANYQGCISYNTAVKTYEIGIRLHGASAADQTSGACGQLPADFQWVTRYTAF